MPKTENAPNFANDWHRCARRKGRRLATTCPNETKDTDVSETDRNEEFDASRREKDTHRVCETHRLCRNEPPIVPRRTTRRLRQTETENAPIALNQTKQNRKRNSERNDCLKGAPKCNHAKNSREEMCGTRRELRGEGTVHFVETVRIIIMLCLRRRKDRVCTKDNKSMECEGTESRAETDDRTIDATEASEETTELTESEDAKETG